MRRKMEWVTGAASAAVVLGGAWVAVAAVQQPARDRLSPNALVVTVGGFELEDYLDGSDQLGRGDREKATRAALAMVGPGRVTEVERDGDSGSTYQVEVRLPDGSEIDVALGADFQIPNAGASVRD